VCGKCVKVLLVYLQCVCYRRGLEMWQLQSVLPPSKGPQKGVLSFPPLLTFIKLNLSWVSVVEASI
jgi:hypothetical protein